MVLANLQIYEWNQRFRCKFHFGVFCIYCCCIIILFIIWSLQHEQRTTAAYDVLVFVVFVDSVYTPNIYFNKLCKFQQKLNHPPGRIGKQAESRAVFVQSHQPKTRPKLKRTTVKPFNILNQHHFRPYTCHFAVFPRKSTKVSAAFAVARTETTFSCCFFADCHWCETQNSVGCRGFHWLRVIKQQ